MVYVRLSFFFLFLAVALSTQAQQPAQFGPYTTYPLDAEAQTVAVGDLNGDSRDDVALAAWPSTLFVFYQQADGALGSPEELFAPNTPLGLEIGDLNADGRKDLVIGGSGGLVLMYYQGTDGYLQMPIACHAYGSNSGLAIGDFNSDGVADIAASTTTYNAVCVLLQDPEYGFGLPAIWPTGGGNGRSVVKLDYNSDGRDDLAMLLSGQICYLLQNPSDGFGPPQYLPALWAHSLAAGDVTGDGLDDLVFSAAMSQPDSAIGVYAQSALGPIFFGYPSYDFAQPIALGDLDGNGANDVAAAHPGYDAMTLLRQNPDGTLAAWESYPLPYCNSYQPGGLAIGDLNSDGAPDLALADWWNGLVVIPHQRASDVVPPVCSADLAGTPGLGGWFPPVEMALTASDEGGSGVKLIRYSLDGLNWLEYEQPIPISAQGVTRIGYCAEDVAGNQSHAGWLDIKIDSLAPDVALDASPAILWPPSGASVNVSVVVTASDSGSGLASLHLRVVNEYGLVQPETDVNTSVVSFSLVASRDERDSDGRTYTLLLEGRDAAGNVAHAQSSVVVPKSNSGKLKKPH